MTAVDAVGSPLNVLVVEDEAAIRRVISGYLEQDGFTVTEAADGIAAVHAAREVSPDVIVLDLGLPGLDGIEVCRQVRTFTDAYIIMLTARTDEVDKLIGLSVGADDYLTKPFSARELIARIHVLLRRPRTASVPIPDVTRVFRDLQIDVAAREVTLAGKTHRPDADRVRHPRPAQCSTTSRAHAGRHRRAGLGPGMGRRRARRRRPRRAPAREAR